MDRAFKELTFTIHGIDRPEDTGGLIPAPVFQAKMRDVLTALRAADAANRGRRHRYLISQLRPGSATVGILERAANPKKIPRVSSVATIVDCADAIYHSNFASARRFNGLAARVVTLCRGAGREFSHIDLITDTGEQIRADDFLYNQAERFMTEVATPQTAIGSDILLPYIGQSRDAFDGEIKEVDLRGNTWRGKLILSGFKREIDCTFRNILIDQLRAFLDKRVWVEGTAIYDGTSALPARLEVDRIRGISGKGDLTQWRGNVTPAEPPDWGDDFDRIQ
jgi:hypothetical protein